MNILFIEFDNTGHHITLYMRLLLKEFIKKQDYKIWLLTTKEVFLSNEFRILQLDKIKLNKIFFINIPAKPLNKNYLTIIIYQLQYFLSIFIFFLKNNKNIKPDKIYFNHFDPFIFIFSIFFYFLNIRNVIGLYLNPKFHYYLYNIKNYSILDSFKKYLFSFLLSSKKINKIFVVDELFYKYSRKAFPNNKEKIKLVNEAISNYQYSYNIIKLKSKYGISPEHKVILVYGYLDLRKGIEELLLLYNNANFPTNIIIIFAGIQSQNVKFIFKKKEYSDLIRKKRIILLNRYISDKEEFYLFKITYLTWVAYSGGSHGSSGVLNKSIAMGTPIIVNNKSLNYWLVRKYNIGVSIDFSLKKKNFNIINKIVSEIKFYSILKKNCSIYFQNKNKHNFSKTIVDEL